MTTLHSTMRISRQFCVAVFCMSMMPGIMTAVVGSKEVDTISLKLEGSQLGQQLEAIGSIMSEIKSVKIKAPEGIPECICSVYEFNGNVTFNCNEDGGDKYRIKCLIHRISDRYIINMTIAEAFAKLEGQWTAEIKMNDQKHREKVKKNATFQPHLYPDKVTLVNVTDNGNGGQEYIFRTGCMHPKPNGTIVHKNKTFCEGKPVVDTYRSDTCPWGSKEYLINCSSDVFCHLDEPKDWKLFLHIENEISRKIEIQGSLNESTCTAKEDGKVEERPFKKVVVVVILVVLLICLLVLISCRKHLNEFRNCLSRNGQHRPDSGPGSHSLTDASHKLVPQKEVENGDSSYSDLSMKDILENIPSEKTDEENDHGMKKERRVMSPRGFHSETTGTTKIKRVYPLTEPSQVQQEKTTNAIGNTQRERGNTLNVRSQAPKEKAENAKGQQQQKTGIPHDLEKLTLDIDIASESHSDGITQASGIIVENQAVYQWHPYQDFECVTPYDGGLVPLDNHAETRTEEQKLDEVPSSADSDETNIKAVIEESEPKIEASIQSQEQKEEHEEMMSSETPAMTDKEAVAEANEPELEASIESQEQKEEHDEMMSPVIPAVTDKEAVAETNEPELEASIESQEQNEEHDEMMSSVTPAVTDKEAVAEANEPELEASIESQEQKEEHDEMMSSETPAETNNQAVVDSDQNWLMKFWFDGSIRKRILRSEGKKCTGAIRMGREIPPDSNIFKYLYLLWYISVYLETLCERRRIEDKVNLEMLRYGQPHGMVNHQSPTCQYSELPIFLLVVNYGY